MPIPNLVSKCRLHGVNIFLSASIPTHERRDEYERIPEAPLRIEEAVVCIARAIFMDGGTLVFGAHPSISPLIARVVGHYYLPAPAEQVERRIDRNEHEVHWQNPSVVIYQSRVWEEQWAEATKRLTHHPLVRVEWTEAARGEKVDPLIKDRPQAPESMERMRSVMIEKTSPAAMIAVGGMTGVLDEARLFAELRPEKPIFTLATTGGAAAILTKQERYASSVRVMDREAKALVQHFWEKQEVRHDRERLVNEQDRAFYVPYAFVAQQIVSQLVENLGRLSE